jgi:DNA replication regulator SLD2
MAAQKYKKYNQVRDILDGKVQPPKKENKNKARKADTSSTQTPSKRTRPAATPSKPKPNSDLLDGMETPSIRRLFSPAVPTSIGPTPQRDGKILGLFDLLDEQTPSRPRSGDAAVSHPQLQATPSKRKHAELDSESAIELGRTPQSSKKRGTLGSFATPLKNRDNNVQDVRSPSSATKLQFATPAFLRRAPMPPVGENGAYISPQPIRLPRKPLVRGLSNIVASLRKLEEEKLDDELEAMHEMENEAGMGPPSQPPRPKEAPKNNILEPDSQSHQLLGGFDNEGELDSEPEPELGRDGLPLRIYKKKGQKRTTRKVNMKPTRAKRPQQPLEGEPGSDIEEGDAEVVPETQFDAARAMGDGEYPLDLESDAELTGSDYDGEERRTKKPKPVKKEVAKTEKENPIKRAAKKVNAMAHANFKRLKLRNNGAKGGPGFGSRFRRRR